MGKHKRPHSYLELGKVSILWFICIRSLQKGLEANKNISTVCKPMS